MRILFPLFLFLSFPAIGQIQIVLTVKIENGNKQIDTVYKDKDGNFLNDSAAISNAIKQGGKIIILTNNDVNFQLQKDAGQQGIKLLTQEAITTNETVIPFDNTLKIKRNNTVSDDRLTNPDATLQNLLIHFTERSNGQTIETIQVNGIVSKYQSVNPIVVNQNGQTLKPCDNCNDAFNAPKAMVLYYDFQCKSFFQLVDTNKIPVNIAKLHLKNKQQIRLIIENINRYVQDVSITTNDITYESEMSPLFKNFFFGDSTKLLGSLMNASLESLKDPTLTDKFDNYKKSLGEFNEIVNKLKAKRLSAFYTCNSFPCCNEKTITTTFEEAMSKLSKLRSDLFDLQVQALVNGTPEETQKAILQLKKDISDCNTKQQTVDELKKKRVALKPEEVEAIKKAEDDIKAAEKLLCVGLSLSEQLSEKNQLLLVLKSIEALQTSLPSEEDITRLFLFAQNVRKTYNRFIAPPIFVNGNALELTIHIKPNDSSLVKKWSTNPTENDSISVEIPVLWKPFVSFSAGSYISIGTQLYNKTYDWQVQPSANSTVTDSSRFLLTESGYTSPASGFAALVNMEIKASPTFGVGFSVGVGLTIEKTPRISYLAGGSLFLGDKRQLALTLGIAAMQINKLKSNLQAVADQRIIYTYRAPIEYYKELKVGAFVSLTYTPFTFTSKTRSRSK